MAEQSDLIFSDFNPAKDIKDYVIRFVLNDLEEKSKQCTEPESRHGFLTDGREIKLFFPGGIDSLRRHLSNDGATKECTGSQSYSNELYFVLFVGHKKRVISTEQRTVELSWEIDNGLKQDLSEIKEIILYASCERSIQGDWTNMVLFNNVTVLDRWRQSKMHATAVRDFSPKFYSQIRIHRGKLDGSFHDGVFRLTRTLFLDYDIDDGQSKRQEKYWDNEQLEIPFIIKV